MQIGILHQQILFIFAFYVYRSNIKFNMSQLKLLKTNFSTLNYVHVNIWAFAMKYIWKYIYMNIYEIYDENSWNFPIQLTRRDWMYNRPQNCHLY